MKWILGNLVILFMSLFSQSICASQGPFFNVESTGLPANINITLCLNGNGPLSCQHYVVSALNLIISTIIPNKTYSSAGIKIDTPGCSITNQCIPNNNGYCLFSVSNTKIKNISLNNSCALPILYVENYQNNTVSAINTFTNRIIAVIPVGSNPVAIAITPDKKTAYITDNGTNTVTSINLETNTPIATITVGNRPYGIAITPDGTMVYVVNYDDSTVTPINITTNTVGTPIPVGANPIGIAITPDGTKAYVTNNGENTVTPRDPLISWTGS